MKSYSFLDLTTGKALENICCIVIPKIQRDYAQGRRGQRATDVRNQFTASLIATMKASDGAVQMLDFIYGYLRDGNFEPLDGQQRLTTLFLLHFLVLPTDCRHRLVADDEQPVLSYRTRPSARDFCKFLVQIDMSVIAKAFDNAVAIADPDKKPRPKLSAFIRELDEFRYNWTLDPTVESMLQMLDSLMAQFGTFKEISALNPDNLNNIRFHIRNLDDLEQGDDLYVKMNARGLELSDFDNTKSALEGDMLSAEVDECVQAAWRSIIDGSLIDFFWHRAGADNPDKELKLKDIRAIEDDLKTFLLRLAALQWLEKLYGSTASHFESEILELTELRATKRDQLNSSLTKYLALRFSDIHGDAPGSCPIIDYAAIVDDINSLLYSDEPVLAADSLAPSVRTGRNAGFIDIMVESDFTHVNRVILYGMLAFTRRFKASQIKKDPELTADWTTWLRVLRNIALARNSNSPFDASENVVKAMAGIKDFIDKFVAKKESDPAISMSQHVIATSAINGIDDFIFQEEQQKERLRADKDWAACLDRFENEGYLFGQLRAPLQWCDGDMQKFEQYASIINHFMEYGGVHLYIGLLLASDCDNDRYPMGDTLLTFDNDRDRSFKRYMRETAGNQYGPALRKLADLWINRFADTATVDQFLKAVIVEYGNAPSIPLWKRQLAEFPEIIYERSYQRRILVSDNPYLIESKQYIKRWNINLCWLKKTRYSDAYFVLHNTKEEDFTDSISGGKLTLADGPQGDLFIQVPSRRPRFRTIGRGRKTVKRRRQ